MGKKVIAITGGIGSGKSYVCSLLQQEGIEVYDCDRAAKRIMRSVPAIREQLTALIGPDTYIDGELNKAAVARFILSETDNKQAVNAIVHPAVARDFLESRYEWIESAILFEAGFDRLISPTKVVCVSAPRETRMARIMVRDGLTREKAAEWIDQQMPQEETERRSDYVIINDGNEQELKQQLHKLLEQC